MKTANIFMKNVHASFVSDLSDNKVRVRIPGTDGMSFITDASQVFDACDANGNAIPKHVNVKLGAPEDKIDVTCSDEHGNPQRKEMSAKTVSSIWSRSQAEFAEKKGKKVYLNGVNEKLVRDSRVLIGSPDSGVYMKQVTIADPASAPQPIRDKDGNIVAGQFRSTGYGTFLVAPDAIVPTAGKPGKVNIYIGRENDRVRAYQVFTGEYDENGKGIYAKADRTAADLKAQYAADIQAYAQRATA